jgi:hypothetical protein
MEDKLSNGKINYNQIGNLVKMYTKCVEYFDSKNDPAKKYF